MMSQKQAQQPLPPRLNSVVGERIVAVIDSLLERCTLLPYLSATCTAQTPITDEDLASAGSGSADLTTETKQLLLAHRKAERAFAADPDSRELSLAVEETTRKLLHHLTKHPKEQQMIQKAARVHVPTSYSAFMERLTELKDILHLKLTTNVEDERSQQEKVNKLRASEKKNIATIKSLETKLRLAQREHEEEVERRDSIIATLEDDLDVITQAAADKSRQTLREARRKEDHHKHTQSQETKQLTEQLAKVEKELADLRQQHKDAETKLRKRKLKLQAQIEGWIIKYDQDMGDKQRELDSIQRQYEAEAKQLSQLQERFSALEVEYNRIMDERRMDREQKQMAEEEMQSMIRAALLIQASWKSYKSRKAAKKAASKKKGKKGKKKK